MTDYVQQLEDLGFEEAPYDFAEGGDVSMEGYDPQQLAQFGAELRPEIEGMDVSPEDAEMLHQVFMYMIKNKKNYKKIREELIESDAIDPEDLPEKYDAKTLGAMLLVLDELKDAKSPQQAQAPQQAPQYAEGGEISEVAAQGRNGDTMLAHVTPEESALLQTLGGSGTINPVTGLPEFFLKKIGKAIKGVVKGVGDVAKKVVSSPIGKIAATVALGAVLGPAGVGLSSTLAGAASGALVGGASAAAQGKSILKGALTGGALGGLGGATFQGMGGVEGISSTYAKEGIGGLLKSAGSNLVSSPGTLTKELGSLVGMGSAPGAASAGAPAGMGDAARELMQVNPPVDMVGTPESIMDAGMQGGSYGGAPIGAGDVKGTSGILDIAKKYGQGALQFFKDNPNAAKWLSMGAGAIAGIADKSPATPAYGGGTTKAPPGPPSALTRRIEQSKYGPIVSYSADGGPVYSFAEGGPVVLEDGGFVFTKRSIDGKGGEDKFLEEFPGAEFFRGPGNGTSDDIDGVIVGEKRVVPAKVSNGEAYLPKSEHPPGGIQALYDRMHELERRA